VVGENAHLKLKRKKSVKKSSSVALAVLELKALVSKSVENSKFQNSLMEGLRIDLKTFLGLAMPNQEHIRAFGPCMLLA